MIKNILLLTAFISSLSFAQNFEKCGTHQLIQHQESLTPGYLQSVNETFSRAKDLQGGDRTTVYTIPVVVHIVYNTPQQNLHDSIIFNQIDRLNEDFRRLNADTINLRDTFMTLVGDSFIEFELASTDPDGNSTTGITRTSTSQASFFGVGGFPAEGVKSTANGGIDPWNQADYLNIWVCDMSIFGTPAVLGYATPPNNLSHWPPGSADNMSDGVVIQYQAFGGNNPNTIDMGNGPMDIKGRTSVHEIGHYLGLRHIWADGGCTEEDGIDDTPNAADQSNFDCNIANNTCTDNIGTLGDLPDMVENYMDYSAETCQNSFTQGQVDMMRSILENYRFELINGTPYVGQTENSMPTVNIYPNPTNSNFVIDGISSSTDEIVIFNEAGQIIHEIKQPTGKINVDGLLSGTYIVRILSSEGVINKKLIVL
ncbi:T9SS type A sorting domain-containing protein [Paracrocinitomix mangrovi]|uniref:M43 family zinc metalloprotease n=1 Tax=Paracrocinitomix mangrovi TaxID=2862509 RepID=UPI001C8D132B|nr:M43 family zinc metalloprotease [Paracrocinitomix mangrovi]UKN00796.1 T9SS type A sorting domain-containing protein [Paracrocinitomix mangrovi]